MDCCCCLCSVKNQVKLSENRKTKIRIRKRKSESENENHLKITKTKAYELCPSTMKEFVQKFEFVWNDEIGRILMENIKKEAMRLDEYLVDIQSRYDGLECGKLKEADVQSVKRIQKEILENVRIFDEQNKKQWVPLKTQNAMNGYDDMYGEDLEQKYEDVNRLMTRLSFLKGYVSGYRKGRNGENM
eukprot:441893_1